MGGSDYWDVAHPGPGPTQPVPIPKTNSRLSSVAGKEILSDLPQSQGSQSFRSSLGSSQNRDSSYGAAAAVRRSGNTNIVHQSRPGTIPLRESLNRGSPAQSRGVQSRKGNRRQAHKAPSSQPMSLSGVAESPFAPETIFTSWMRTVEGREGKARIPTLDELSVLTDLTQSNQEAVLSWFERHVAQQVSGPDTTLSFQSTSLSTEASMDQSAIDEAECKRIRRRCLQEGCPKPHRSNGTKYPCVRERCDARFDDFEGLSKHLQIAEPFDFYRCPECDKIVKRHISEHLRNTHGLNMLKKEMSQLTASCKIAYNPPWRKRCGFCGLLFAGQLVSTWTQLYKHIFDDHLVRGQTMADWRDRSGSDHHRRKGDPDDSTEDEDDSSHYPKSMHPTSGTASGYHSHSGIGHGGMQPNSTSGGGGQQSDTWRSRDTRPTESVASDSYQTGHEQGFRIAQEDSPDSAMSTEDFPGMDDESVFDLDSLAIGSALEHQPPPSSPPAKMDSGSDSGARQLSSVQQRSEDVSTDTAGDPDRSLSQVSKKSFPTGAMTLARCPVLLQLQSGLGRKRAVTSGDVDQRNLFLCAGEFVVARDDQLGFSVDDIVRSFGMATWSVPGQQVNAKLAPTIQMTTNGSAYHKGQAFEFPKASFLSSCRTFAPETRRSGEGMV